MNSYLDDVSMLKGTMLIDVDSSRFWFDDALIKLERPLRSVEPAVGSA